MIGEKGKDKSKEKKSCKHNIPSSLEPSEENGSRIERDYSPQMH